MKDNCIIVGVILILLAFGYMIHDAKADEHQPMDVTQHLYDQAITEIADGNREFGCHVLRDALLASHEVDDNFVTYNQIWAVGIQACNWINNPSTIETSTPN